MLRVQIPSATLLLIGSPREDDDYGRLRTTDCTVFALPGNVTVGSISPVLSGCIFRFIVEHAKKLAVHFGVRPEMFLDL
jgi:hypothetical protein